MFENRMILAASLHNLFETMQPLVNKFVQAYKDDFEIDKNTISEKPHHTFLWLIRRNGTQLVDLTEMYTSGELQQTALFWHWQNTKEKRVYIVNIGSVKRLYAKSVERIFREGYKA